MNSMMGTLSSLSFTAAVSAAAAAAAEDKTK
jgi:hypothetical protein